MADENKPRHPDEIDRQIQRLAGELRDRGTAPERDLWTGIDRAITAAEQHQIRPHARWSWPRMAASAAAVLVLVFAGWTSVQQQISTEAQSPLALLESPVAAESDETNGLAAIDLALEELNLALSDDPENRSLGNLAQMLHQSRGRMLRQNMELRLMGG